LAMAARKEIAPELLAEGKYLYEHTLTSVEEIAARMEISRSTLYVRLRAWGWQRRRYSPSAAADGDRRAESNCAAAVASRGPAEEMYVEPDRSSADDASPVTVEKRAALFARAFRAAELQMDSIETAMKQLCATPAPFERTARALAMLNRSLRDILTLTKADEMTPADEADDDAIPRDMDEFRRELARRIQQLVDVERRRESEGSGAGGAG
jgi:hypothetical protein